MRAKRRFEHTHLAKTRDISPGQLSHKKDMPTELARKLLMIFNEKKKKVPLKNMIGIDISLRNIRLGKKMDISKKCFDMAFKYEYRHILEVVNIRWGERKFVRRFIESSMEKMYNVV